MDLHRLIANRYEIDNLHAARIGRGGAGNVYRATDLRTHRIVAVKQLKPELIAGDPHVVARFDREGEALRRLNHPNIVTVLEMVVEGDEHYLVMEYVPGGSLADVLHDSPGLPIEQVLQIGLELADALTRAHHLNIIHRDIKPGNVLLAEDGTPRLTDFGVAHMADLDRITQTGTLTGTYAYLSPEACEGEVLDARADIWSFGVLLYEMLTGRVPFAEPTLTATLLAILGKPVPDLHQFRPGIPEALANLIYRMLQKDRQQRISSIRLVGAQLEAILSGLRGGTGNRPRFESTPSPPAMPVLGPRHNLPRQPTLFVGREPEIQELVGLLGEPDCRLLTLVGPGGIGKTRLAVEAARRKVEDYEHGVRFVALAPVSAPEFLATAIADGLGLAFYDQHDPETLLVNYLREKRMLLVLDNFEHLVEGASFVSELLAQAPLLTILVTSREALNLWEEWTRPVRGMRYPDDLRETDLEPYSAVKLFLARARRVQSDLAWQAALPDIIRICQLVDGMPLGIELAATWLRVLTVPEIVHEIEQSFDFLATNMRNIAERHRSIRAVFDYSWQLLDEREQQVFRRLAIFQGGFDRPAAAAVAGAPLLALTNLVDKSLLYEGDTHYTDAPPDEGRYTIHELLKQYAQEKLHADEAEQARMAERHAVYYAQLLWRMEPRLRSGQQREALEAISQDLDNIRQAWRWAVAHVHRRPAARQCLLDGADSLYIFYETRGLVAEGLESFDRAVVVLQASEEADPLVMGKMLVRLGVFFFRYQQRPHGAVLLEQGVALLRGVAAGLDPAGADWLALQRDIALGLTYLSFVVSQLQTQAAGRAMLQQALDICRQIGDRWGEARATNAQAILTPNFWEQRALYEAALAICREIGDQILAARILLNLSAVNNAPESAFELAQEILTISEHIGNPAGVAMGYFQYGLAAMRQGDFVQAQQYLARMQQLVEEYGLLEIADGMLVGQAQVAWALGDAQAAQRCFEKLVQASTDPADYSMAVKMLFSLGEFLIDQGDYEAARQKYKAGLGLLESIPAGQPRAEALDALGNFALALQEYDRARQHFHDDMPLFREAGNENGVAWALTNLGHIAFQLGDYPAAQAYYIESLGIHYQVGLPWNIGQVQGCLGRVAFALGDAAAAAEHYRAALQTLQTVWAKGDELEILVDWASLLVRQSHKAAAMAMLYCVCRDPLYVPAVVNKRTRQKAARLLEELVAYLPPEEVAAAELWAQGRSSGAIVAAILAGDALAMFGGAAGTLPQAAPESGGRQ